MTKNDFDIVIKKELDQSNKGTVPFRWDMIWLWINKNYEPKKLVNIDQRVMLNFAWTQEKPKTVGLYFRSNPALQHEISEQIVFNIDNKLWTYHPHNESTKRIEVENMPDSFWWIQLPMPKHWNISLDYDN